MPDWSSMIHSCSNSRPMGYPRPPWRNGWAVPAIRRGSAAQTWFEGAATIQGIPNTGNPHARRSRSGLTRTAQHR